MKRLLSDISQLHQVLNGVANGITVQDPTGKLVFVNLAAARMMNCASPEEAVAKGGAKIVEDFHFYDEQGTPVDVLDLPGRRALEGVEEPSMVVCFRLRSSNTPRWTSIKALPVFDGDQVVLAVNVLEDITRLKEVEQRLKETNGRITDLLEQVLLKS